MRIRYELTIDDFAAFQRYHQLNSPAVMNGQRRLYAMVPLFVVAVAAVQAFALGSLVVFIIGAFVAAVAGWYVMSKGPTAYLDAVEKQVRKMFLEGENKSLFGPRELEVTEDFIIERSPFHEHIVRWSAVEKIVESWNYGFIYWCGVAAHAVPKKSVAQEEFRAFFDAANRAWKAAKPDVGSPPPTPESRSPTDFARL
jgi:hypothetical protein